MFTVYSDGGSRGNPGKSAYAIVVVKDGKIVHEHAEFLGVHTNNYAEYRGLIAGIAKVLDLGGKEAEFVMDSQLVIKQMNGEYKVKNPDMRALYDDAKNLSSLIPKVSFRNVRRSEELIPRADFLLNQEMDRNRSLDARYQVGNLHEPLLTGGHVPQRNGIVLELLGADDDSILRSHIGGVLHGLSHLAAHDVDIRGNAGRT